MTQQHLLSEKALPDPGPQRWWRVDLVENAATKPIKVSLMEDFSPFQRGPSRVLAHRRTVARPVDVITTAEKIIEEVGKYAQLVGDYPEVHVSPKIDSEPGWVVTRRGQTSTAHYYEKDSAQSACGDAVDYTSKRELGDAASTIDCPACFERREA